MMYQLQESYSDCSVNKYMYSKEEFEDEQSRYLSTNIMYFSYDLEFLKLLNKLKSIYPPEIFEIDGIGKQLDINYSSKMFFKNFNNPTADKSVDANANVSGNDVITYNYEVPKPLMKLNSYYNLWKTLREQHGIDRANEIIEMQIRGDIYINDVVDIGKPYCFNYSTYDIALEGLKMGSRLVIEPPKSLASFLRQLEQFTVYAANSTLGATGLADTLITASWYVDRILETGKDHHYFVFSKKMSPTKRMKLAHTYIYEQLTSLIYTLNWEFRGNQSPFTNLSIYDSVFLKELVPTYIIKDKAPQIETVQMVQEIFVQAYNDTLARTPITFPVLTACFSIREENGTRVVNDHAFVEFIAKNNLKYSIFNIYNGETSTLSSCCRLRSKITDISELGYTNTFGAGSTKIGSLGVVTLNLYKIAYISFNKEKFLDKLRKYVDVVRDINHAKRCFIQDRINRGSLPLYTLGYMDINKQFSTVGFTGLYEALQLFQLDIRTPEGLQFAEQVLDTINDQNRLASEKLGTPHNMEQVPAETSSIKIAEKDRVLGYNLKYTYYSNQFIPLISQVNVLDRIRVQGALDSKCTGGAICHINVNEPIEDIEVIKNLIHYCAEQGVVYWAINYALGYCQKHGMSVVRDHTKPSCEICKAPVDVFSRVVGFLTNTKNWNKTRRTHDWPNRVFYNNTVKE